MKVESNFHYIYILLLGSGSTTDEPWQAQTFKKWDESNKTAVISCE
jgi:hypothetical protein